MANPIKHKSHHSIFHVMMRGANKQEIFHNIKDYLFFCKILEDAKKMFCCKIHLFCLMTNHFHLVIETSHIPLSKIMHNINLRYSIYFNKTTKRVGHLFQARYKSKLVGTKAYLLELCYYIHYNPVKAGMVADPKEYSWSSHQAYTKQFFVSWVDTAMILELLRVNIDSESPYQSFIYEREKFYEPPFKVSYDQDGFFILEDLTSNNTPTIKKKLNLECFSIQEIADIVCDFLGITYCRLISPSRHMKYVIARTMVAYYAHYFGHYQLNHIALILCRKADPLSRSMHRVLAKSKSDMKIQKIKSNLEVVFAQKIVDFKLKKKVSTNQIRTNF